MSSMKLMVVDGIDGMDIDEAGVELVDDSTAGAAVAVGRTGRGTVARWCQRGMVSAEWAVGIIAAVALAGVLIAVVTHGQVRDALLKFVIQVIHSFSGYVQ